MPSPGAAHVVSGHIAGPHHAEQEGHQRRPVALLVQGGQRQQREPGIEQAEDGCRGIRHDLHHRPEKRAVDEQPQAENAEESGGAFRPLEADGKQGQQGNQESNARRPDGAFLRQADVLPGRQHRHRGHRESEQPSRGKKHQNQDDRDENKSGKNAFHSGLRIHCRDDGNASNEINLSWSA